MLKVIVDLSKKKLTVDGNTFTVSCLVRTFAGDNDWRKSNQVVYSTPLPDTEEPRPYDPRPFPKGTWRITGLEYTDDPVYAPVKIKTNAFQYLPVWELKDGQYYEQTLEETRDSCYWLHFSKGSSTTLGCIRLNSEEDANTIACILAPYLDSGDIVFLEVI